MITHVLVKMHTWTSEYTVMNIILQQDSWVSTSVLREVLDRSTQDYIAVSLA